MIKISFIGDIALNGLLTSEVEYNKIRFNPVREELKDTFVFCNLETPIKIGHFLNPNKNIHHFTSEEVGREVLSLLNIKMVSLANNHIGDCGLESIKKTISILDDLGILHTGAGYEPKHLEPAILIFENKTIGFLAYVNKSTNPKTETLNDVFINYFEPAKVVKDIKSLRENVHKIICSIHWGNDYSRFFSKEQIIISRRLMDAGADIIMGHHPHTYQPYEVYKGKYIFYSLGQLCFGDFYWEGELRALKRRTKTSYIPIINNNLQILRFIKTKEKKGNYIKVYSGNWFFIYNKILLSINELKNRNQIVNYIIKVKETVFDRFIEYFFGYYRNPFKQLINFKNLKKINYIKRDINKPNG